MTGSRCSPCQTTANRSTVASDRFFATSVPTDDLIRLVAVEQECCHFFRFAITVDTRGSRSRCTRTTRRGADRRVHVRGAGVSPKKEDATILGVGVVACAVCCAGPILAALAAIGLATTAVYLLISAIALVIGAASVAVVVVRRQRVNRCRSLEPDVVHVEISRRNNTLVTRQDSVG